QGAHGDKELTPKFADRDGVDAGDIHGRHAAVSIWRSRTPAFVSSCSNENEHPSTKATKSLRHRSRMSLAMPVITPARKTRYSPTSVRKSISSASAGIRGLPGSDMPRSGHGRGLFRQ